MIRHLGSGAEARCKQAGSAAAELARFPVRAHAQFGRRTRRPVRLTCLQTPRQRFGAGWRLRFADGRAEAHLAIETRRESWMLAVDAHGSLTERDRAGYVACLARELLERSGMIGIAPYRVRAMFQQDHRRGRTPLFGNED